MNTGCPRVSVQDAALQLLQLLDQRFFGNVRPLPTAELETIKAGTLDALLTASYCRNQMYLSRQLAQLHPELTMPMFSEITHRFQTARREVRQLLLQYLLPWLHNMELVDPNVPPPANPSSYYQYYTSDVTRGGTKREGWGTAEATEMVLNNLFYITVKFSDEHPKEVEELWSTLCGCWPNNLKVIIRYLIIISGMAPQELLPYAKRVVLFLARSRPERLVDEMMTELQTVETLNCLIERTETPPFYRLTSMRKASSHSDAPAADPGNPSRDLAVEKGTIHTKRHSGEDPVKTGSKSDTALRALAGFQTPRVEKTRTTSGPPILPDDLSTPTTEVELTTDETIYVTRIGSSVTNKVNHSEKFDIPQPHPLPMPEYGGYFAPLTEYLPDSSQPISGFHRCNIAVMLLTDIVVDGIQLDWAIHVPLMLHIIFLGLDHSRPLVRDHCRMLLMNLLVVLGDHLQSKELDNTPLRAWPASAGSSTGVPPVIVTPEDAGNWTGPQPGPNMPIQDVIRSLINFLASKTNQPLWNYEDMTAKVWWVRSAEQLTVLLRHVLRVFRDSLPHAHVSQRWAETALQLGLSCSSRHYAGRSLQVFRALRVPITSRMLSDILSRLVETVAEQGEDMQGYVTELLLTLEAAVDSLESDFRPLDFMKEIFKSTPNLNNKDPASGIILGKRNVGGVCGYPGPHVFTHLNHASGHTRSTSYSVSYCMRKSAAGSTATTSTDPKELDSRVCGNKYPNSNLSRSRSAQSLKLLGDSATQDDKMTILAQLFWLSVSLLESDYEHEFLLALRLLGRVLHRLPLDRPDARDKVEKLQQQLGWNSFPGVHALLLKGCTSPNTYEPVVTLLSQFTPLLDLPFVDPTQNLAFPMNVISLLPYMLLNYEDANELCIRSAENIAQVSAEKGKKLDHLGTVMTLYSRRTFSKESFQWTKCVVKYLYDTYAHLSFNMLAFLVEVIFSQSSDLMERQSSMASSTEEMSGANNDLSGGSRRDDEQFGVFKDFDFLEYESESVEGESTDNFNWGVRRRPLSEGEEREPSLRQFEESLSEKTLSSNKLTSRRGVAEESSDDEVGSESPLDEVPSGSGTGQEINNIPGMFPPSSLSLIPSRSRHDSSTRSDTSGSSAGDLGDVTPCNASPNLSALMPFRQVVRDDAEEIWRQQIQNLISQPPYNILEFFHLLSRILRDVSSKSVGLSREAVALLTNGSTAASQLASQLSSHAELLSSKAEPPLIWFSLTVFGSQRLSETLRFSMFEIQEHLETFLDKKDHATECLEAVKATNKLQVLGGDSSAGQDQSSEEMHLVLGRAFYKLHFQLLLMIEASNKMLLSLTKASKNVTVQLHDMSVEISMMKTALCRALEESTESERGTPTPTPSPSPLPSGSEDMSRVAEFLRSARWSSALEAVRIHRAQWPSDPFHDDDDVTTAVNMYCRHLGQERSDLFVVTKTDSEMTDIFDRLMESLFRVLAAVTGLEAAVKAVRLPGSHHSKLDC
ncbi:GSCOCG00002390001-RA-CDS [Cotesia congregata]|nr:GSCOCG00002390001-RA-CDS [Cotesia congregata]